MRNQKIIEWILRIAVAGTFMGHGVFGLQGKMQWLGWFQKFGVQDAAIAAKLLFLIGLIDVAVSLIVLIKPIPLVLLWATLWAFWASLVRPIVGEPIWDFIERWSAWGAPLALLLLIGWPKTIKEWFGK